MITMFIKRVINTTFSAPMFALGAYFLFIGLLEISKMMKDIELYDSGIIHLLKEITCWYGSVMAFGGSVFCFLLIPFVIVTGDGVLWKRIYKHSCLFQKNGELFHVYDRDQFVFRLNPILWRYKLVCPTGED